MSLLTQCLMHGKTMHRIQQLNRDIKMTKYNKWSSFAIGIGSIIYGYIMGSWGYLSLGSDNVFPSSPRRGALSPTHALFAGLLFIAFGILLVCICFKGNSKR